MFDALIKSQHEHFDIEYSGPSRILDPEEENFRLAAMLEELSEFVLSKTITDKHDALLDLMIFAAGTLERMGLPIDEPAKQIVMANLKKQLGPNKKRGSFSLDLVKPEGWEPANLERYIRQ